MIKLSILLPALLVGFVACPAWACISPAKSPLTAHTVINQIRNKLRVADERASYKLTGTIDGVAASGTLDFHSWGINVKIRIPDQVLHRRFVNTYTFNMEYHLSEEAVSYKNGGCWKTFGGHLVDEFESSPDLLRVRHRAPRESFITVDGVEVQEIEFTFDHVGSLRSIKTNQIMKFHESDSFPLSPYYRERHKIEFLVN